MSNVVVDRTNQQIKDGIEKSADLESSASEIDGSVDYFSENISVYSRIYLNGSTSKVALDQDYSIENTGDYIEFEAKFKGLADDLSNLSFIGKGDGASSNTVGWRSASDFWVRDSAGAWSFFNGLGSVTSGDFFNKYKLLKNGATLELYINDVLFDTKATTAPLVLNSIGDTYTTLFCKAEINYIKIKTSTREIESRDIGNDVRFTQTDIDSLKIVPLENISKSSEKLNCILLDSFLFIFKKLVNNKYLRYELRREIDGVKNADIWRITQAYIFDENFQPDYAITRGGEWETAIQITGAGDFMGGISHGNELLTSVTLIVDGIEKDLTENDSFECMSVTLFQESDLIAPTPLGNAGSTVANASKRWVFSSNGDNQIDQNVKWLTVESLVKSYQFMCPIYRDNLGAQITNSVIFAPVTTKYDVANSGHSAPTLSGTNWGNNLSLWGNTEKISLKIESVGVREPLSNIEVSDSTLYNKVYYDATGSITTAIGQEVYSKIKFSLMQSKIS